MVKMFSRILKAATQDVLPQAFGNVAECKELKDFADRLDAIEFLEIPDDTDTDISDEDYNRHSQEICRDYSRVKTLNEVRTMILTCNRLIAYKKSLTCDKNKMSGAFIARIPGLTFQPFPFSTMNFKELWVAPTITTRLKKYLLTVLRITLTHCLDIYKIVTSPDVDVEDFSAAIIESIAQIKKQIPRCEKAFAKIEDSIHLLEGNFNTYYKDFVQSNNPSTIIESFVLDVSNSTGGDAQTARQFRKIINHYRKMTAGKIKDPKIKNVFDALNSNFDAMSNELDSDKNIAKNRDNLDV
jgi:hypothetical protein